MTHPSKYSKTKTAILLSLLAIIFLAFSCAPQDTKVADNIKKYSFIWDEIMNKGKLDMFNEENFSSKVVMHVSPKDITGIDSARNYYANFLTGFSNIEFTIKDVFGQGDKIVKYWNFKGTHTGVFFGIPPTGKTVNVEGTTLVRMENGKIAEEKDFFDNLEFLQQLGLIPRMM